MFKKTMTILFCWKLDLLNFLLESEPVALWFFLKFQEVQWMEDWGWSRFEQEYSLPNRANITGKLLDNVWKRCWAVCKSLEGKIWNFGAWCTVYNDPVLCACVITEQGTIFLTGRTDTSRGGGGAAHTYQLTQAVLRMYPRCEDV